MVQKILYLPALASAHGGALDRMTLWVHLLMLFLFVVWALNKAVGEERPKGVPA